jgi:hypothetical protein
MVTKDIGGMEVLGNGIVQFVTSEYVIASKGHKLYKRNYKSSNWQLWCSLPVSFSNKLSCSNRWLARLSRKEIHHFIKVREGLFCCFAFGKIYLIDSATGIEIIGHTEGSRPLKVCSDGHKIYYGVYIGNEERKPIKLFAYSLEEKKWSIYHTFTNIRHIHGVFWDEYESSIWVTTGDLDHESTIWKFNNIGKPEKVVGGSQQTRAVDLLFNEESIFYATDAPDEPNYIYRLDRESGNTEQLKKVGGPVFYGRKTGDWLFFSTVVEPSEVNRTDAVELWGSNDKGKSWKKIREFEKDIGHMKLFQYGQIKFPNGPGDGEHLWFTPYATEHDHQIMRVNR